MTRALLAFTLAALVACAPALTACSGRRGPGAVRIDPAFSADQRDAIAAAVDAWDGAAGLTVGIAAWSVTEAIPVERDDALADRCVLGLTHTEHVETQNDRVRLAGAGVLACFGGAPDVGAFDFQTSAAHELGHLFGLTHGGCDGHGHSNNPGALMYASGTPDGARREISAEDVARVDAVVDSAW